MAGTVTSFLSFFLFSLFSAQVEAFDRNTCLPFTCGTVPYIRFPFSNDSNPECGIYNVTCKNDKIPKIKFEKNGREFVVKSMSTSHKPGLLVIQDNDLLQQKKSQICNNLRNFTVPVSPVLTFFLLSPYYTFFKCKRGDGNIPAEIVKLYNYTECTDYNLYYTNASSVPAIKHNCSTIEYPVSEWLVEPYWAKVDLLNLLRAGIPLGWNFTHECVECYWKKKGQCRQNEVTKQFVCSGPLTAIYSKKKIIIGVSTGVGTFLLCSSAFLCYRKKHNQSTSSKLLHRAFSLDPSLKADLENIFPTQFFNYKDLEEATNNFDFSKELGDGGFGTVYHGILRDGRNVAVKRLHENNCKRVEQFRNEISMLSRLRHQNLVTLYGCSSRHSRELLLVYEFIPNGTVADHVHGDLAKPGALTWSTRMSIAIETADALKYLHAVEIIHRDVKTNNILLDNNFHVKVADFGLSRLFPSFATHVSTAPQGTPGYVDPEYHRCYQLTDRSDVYSFGVVLIELISSKPAVDISRHHHEINLAYMAINKIHNHALNELVDLTLGFDSDGEVRRMITQVAELAFRCLQDEREMRPSMEEVLDSLRAIVSGEYKVVKVEEIDTPTDDEVLLEKMPPLSPDTVTVAWESRETTANTSG